MTVSEIQAYADQMPPLRAEWLLDLAQAATYPTTLRFAPDAAQTWWDALMSTAGGAAQATTAAVRQATGFTLNGMAMGFDALAQQISKMLGGGVSR